ncbi:MAG: putative amino acid dehydrogenase [Kiritimatiellia bacterium]|jgi:predicted amino acid dehydrogenase
MNHLPSRPQLAAARESSEPDSHVEIPAPYLARSTLLRTLARRQMLAPLLCSYLESEHQLSAIALGRDPIRLHFANGLAGTQAAVDEMQHHLADENLYALIRHLLDKAPNAFQGSEAVEPPSFTRQGGSDTIRVAWCCHLVDAGELVNPEPSFAHLDVAALESLFSLMGKWLGPIVVDPSAIQFGDRSVLLYPIIIPMTSSALKQSLDARQLKGARRMMQQALAIAQELDCDVISLGQYTSIITRNGKFLSPDLPQDMGLTTGNSFTVSLALQAVEKVIAARGWDTGEETLMVVGALGNIGRLCAEILAPRFKRALLLGSPREGSMERLTQAAEVIPHAVPTTDASRASEARVILAASSGVEALLTPENLAAAAVVCDISVPAAVASNVPLKRPDVTIIRGGLAQLPAGEQLQIPNFPLPVGQVFGCMAEGLLLGLEGVRDDAFTGALTPAHVQRVTEMSRRHGLVLADTHNACLFGA